MHLRIPHLAKKLVWFNDLENHFIFQFSDDCAPKTSQLTMSIILASYANESADMAAAFKPPANILYILYVCLALSCFCTSTSHSYNAHQAPNRRKLASHDLSTNYLQCIHSRVRYKGKLLSAHYNISRPLQKSTKHGMTCLCLPAKAFVLDLCTHVDVARNPGPTKQIAKLCRQTTSCSTIRSTARSFYYSRR